jgi:hypothetical protein
VLGVSRRALVIRAGPAEHGDGAIALDLELGLRHARVLVRVALASLSKPERA